MEAEYPKEIYEFDFEGKHYSVYVLTEDDGEIDPSERFLVQIKPEGEDLVIGHLVTEPHPSDGQDDDYDAHFPKEKS